MAQLQENVETDFLGTLEHIFELMTPTEDVLRHQSIVFLHAKLKVFLSDDNLKEIEEIILQNCKKVLLLFIFYIYGLTV